MYIILYSIIVLSILIITIDGETCPMRGDIRYDSSGGASLGPLQVCEVPTGSSSLQWLYVCNNNWDNGFHESDTWCRQLGYVRSDGADKTNKINSGEYKLTNVDCNENDMRIIDCNFNLDNSECEYEKDVLCINCNNNNQCNNPGTCNTATGKCECMGECMNGGYCYLGVCVCPAVFTGSLCEDCNPACQNNGACNSSGVCVCPYGYTGSTCEIISTTLMTTTSTPLTTTATTTPLTTTITSTPLTTTTTSTPLTTTAITQTTTIPVTTSTTSDTTTTTSDTTPTTQTTTSDTTSTTQTTTPVTTSTTQTTTSDTTPTTQTTTSDTTATTQTTTPDTTSTTQTTTPDTNSTTQTTPVTTSPTQIATTDTTATQTTILTESITNSSQTTTYSTATAPPTETSIPISTTSITNTTDSPPVNGTISIPPNTSIMESIDSTTTNPNSITVTDTMIVSTTTQSITITATNPSNITQQSTTSITEELNSSMGLVIGLTFVVLFILFCILVAASAMVLFCMYRRSYLKKIKGAFEEPITTNLLYRNNTDDHSMKQLDPYYSSILNNITSPINESDYEFIDPDLSMSANYLDFGSSITANVKSTHIGIEITHQLPVNDDIYSNIDELTDDNAEQIYETYINEMYEAFSESEDRNQDIYGIYEQISDPNENEAIVLNSNQREEQSFLGLSETIKQQEYEVMIAPPPKQTSYATNNTHATNTHATTHANITINANAANNSIVEAKNKEIYTEPPKSLRKLFDTLSSKKCREINPALLKMEKEVGSGAFGVVYMATWDSNYGLISVAVKQLKHSTEVHKIGIMQEAAIMRQFNHPNVLSLIGVVSLDEPYMIVTELMKGELKDILMKMKESQIDEFKIPPVLLKFTREIAEGMKHLSEKGFIHRDLAARNVLVARDLTCRIADFGMSRQVTENDEYYKSTGGQIPLRWTAPEAVWYRRFSLSSDVWSFGLTMFEIWSLGMKPWLDYTPKQIIEAYTNQQIHLPPTGCPKEIYRIMIKACNYEPEIRPNFIQICQMLQQPVALLLKRKVTSNAADKLGNDPQLAGQF